MTTQQAIEALHALPRMGQGAPGLARMQNLCDHLGNPEKELQCIHIAGTNGKGSLAAMTSSILTAAGYKTGLTISPYVVDFRERFQIDGEMIPPRTLANLTEKVLDAIDAIEAEGGEKPVEFEAVTALAFLWFAREKCDLVVLETGLGGRCDATNVVPHKLVAAITKIGYDHMEVLGDTLDKIAAEKAGIIKEGTVVVNYPDQPAEAMGPILTAAAEAHTSIITPDKDDLTLLRGKRLENRIDYGGYRAALGLPGTHRPTTPPWLSRSRWLSGASSAMIFRTTPFCRALPMPGCPPASRCCAAIRCCCSTAATTRMALKCWPRP